MRLIGIFFLLCFVFLGGCKESSDIYEGIAKSEFELIKNNSNTEFVYEYSGRSENWVAVYVFYKMKNEEHHLSKPFLKYIGTGQTPTGQLSYEFTAGRETGKGTQSASSKTGIYNLGTYGSGGLGPAEDDNFQVKMQVVWNGQTEKIDLEPNF
ncbi:hypothetical protein [Paenibacillus sp. V4I7]|uniref:hypothetical protein n=1 Tax=Paenibacillus sp. V4I7 TaxID=3042307 RepID=UPI00278871B7|nr:hypothetical protein [Paenibacillus sp. V4I7]MDQ0899921.1 hypothetical protein [Paenibacillus sp. V4I7]